jgi:hypothetical protein
MTWEPLMYNYIAENIWYAVIHTSSSDILSFGNLYFGREISTNHTIKIFETEKQLEEYIDGRNGVSWYKSHKNTVDVHSPITKNIKDIMIAHEKAILKNGWQTSFNYRLSMDDNTYNTLMNTLISSKDASLEDSAKIMILDSENTPRQIKFEDFKKLMFEYNQARILFQMCYNKRIKEIESRKVI